MRFRRKILYATMMAIGLAILGMGVLLSPRFIGQESGPERLLPTEDWGRRIDNPQTRIQAALQAGRDKDDLAEPMLRMQVRKTKDEAFRKACVWALGEIGMKESVPELFEVAKNASLPFDREALENVLEALIKIDDEGATAALLWILKESEAEASATAARMLKARSEPSIIKALAQSTVEGQPTKVRIAALGSLTGGRAKSVARTVRDSLYSEKAEVRQAAYTALHGRRAAAAAAATHSKSSAAEQYEAADAITAWKIFPGTDELIAHVKTLGRVGNADAVVALDHAMATARFSPEVAVAIDAARRAIAERTGRPLFDEIPRPAGAVDFPPSKPKPTPAGLTPDGMLTVILKNALAAETDERFDLTLEFERRAGRWRRHLWGHARDFSHAEHKAELLEGKHDTMSNLKVRVDVNGGAWRPGDNGEYEIALGKGLAPRNTTQQKSTASCLPTGCQPLASKWLYSQFSPPVITGEYCGHYASVPVKGTVTARFMPFPSAGTREPVQSGAHPRLVFLEKDLADLRACIKGEHGQRIVGAFLEVFDRPIDGPDGKLAAAVIHGLFYNIFNDSAHGRRAVELTLSGLADGGAGNVNKLAGRLRNAALAYDLAYDRFPENERRRVTARLARLADAVIPGQGLVGAFDGAPGDIKAAARAAALGLCALATWREKDGLPPSPSMPADAAPVGMTYLDYAVAVTANSTRRTLNTVEVDDRKNTGDRDLAILLLFAHAHERTTTRPLMPESLRLSLTPDPPPEPLLPLAWLLKAMQSN